MRRVDKEIKDQEAVKRALKAAQYMTLAMTKDGNPYLVSLSTGYDEDRNVLYFHSAGEGKKLDYMRANPIVWGQIILDHGYSNNECTHKYVTIMFRGRINFLEALEAKRHAMTVMIKQLDPKPIPLIERLLKSDGLLKTVVGEVELLEISGKMTQGTEL
jgi:hypothetical protein